jgi:serine phosphatase RsbU (regulator of sigma subunit)
MFKWLLNSRARLAVVIAAGVVFALLTFRFEWFGALDVAMYDLGLSIRPALQPASDVVVVAIDRYSRQNAFPPPEFPVSAHIAEHALVLERLADAGAAMVDFDILFDQVDPGLDLGPFVSALAKSGMTCLAGAIESTTLALRSDGSAIMEERLVLPTARIPDSLYCVGLVNMPVDGDGKVRRMSCGQFFQGKWLPSMPVMLASGFGCEGKSGTDQWAACMEATDVMPYIDFRVAEAGITTVPYIDVLQSDGWQDRVAGRIVLIGVTENSLSDVFELPFRGAPGAAQDNNLSGVLVLAHATQTLVSGSVVSPLAGPPGLLLAVALVLLMAILARGSRLGMDAVYIGLAGGGLVICAVLVSGLRVTILPSGLLISTTIVTAVTGLTANYIHARVTSEMQEEQLEEISSDLRKAAEIQQRLQPESMPEVEGVEIAGFQIPCKEIGGDYYDVVDLGERKVGLLIADVCGKGISAALLMSNLQSNFRQLAPVTASPEALVNNLNKIASQVFSEGRFVTLCYSVLDVAGKKLTYCCAGHMPPFVCHADGSVEQLEPGGIPIGPFADFEYEEREVGLLAGDLVFTYTDGLSEATRAKTDEMFSEPHIKAHLEKNASGAPADLNRGIVRAAQEFSGSEQLDDDITVLSARLL